MSLIKTIFGSGEVIKRGFDLIDDMHTSGEEAAAAATDQKVAILSAYEPFKIAQRVLAFSFIGVFLLCFLMCFVALAISLFISFDYQTRVVDPVLQLLDAFGMDTTVTMIMGFYFGAGAAEGIINVIRGRKTRGGGGMTPVINIESLVLPDCTIGVLTCQDFKCFSLELPWRSNQRSVSCIPAGDYESVWYDSPRHGRVLLLKDVPERDWIELHAANFTRQIEGCICVGSSIKFLDGDDTPDVTNSKNTVAALFTALDGDAPLFSIRGAGREI